MDIPKVQTPLYMRKKAARNAVDIALSYESVSKKLRGVGAYTLAYEYERESLIMWAEVEELYSELDRYKERMKLLEPECWSDLECRIYDV